MEDSTASAAGTYRAYDRLGVTRGYGVGDEASDSAWAGFESQLTISFPSQRRRPQTPLRFLQNGAVTFKPPVYRDLPTRPSHCPKVFMEYRAQRYSSRTLFHLKFLVPQATVCLLVRLRESLEGRYLDSRFTQVTKQYS